MELPKRKNHRLKYYDYGAYGYYYVTICTKNKRMLLSEIVSNVGSDALVAPCPKVVPTELGKRVLESWHRIASMNVNVEIDKFVMMPNHIHGIIIIKNEEAIKMTEKTYGFEITERRGRRSLQGLMKDFKSVTTRVYKRMYCAEDSLWQESFFEEVIKSQKQYEHIWQYIDENPINWEADELYTETKMEVKL